MRTLHVVRHSQSTHNRDRIWAGWHDPPLTGEGRLDAWHAAAHWRHHGLAAVTSSDLRRASEGAAIIAGALHLPLLAGDAGLRERDAGTWQGRAHADIADDPHYLAWKDDPALTPPGGETWADFTGRIVGTVMRHLSEGPPGATLAVAHDGVLQALTLLTGAPGHPCRPLRDSMRLTIVDGKLRADVDRPRAAKDCDICRIMQRPTPDGHLGVTTRHHHINSYREAPEETERPGWIIVSPIRHVTRWHQLDAEETRELADICRTLDTALTLHTGARRVMIASLGWETEAHLHMHCVPTFHPQETEGYLNFDGRYRRSAHIPDDLHQNLAEELRNRISGAR